MASKRKPLEAEDYELSRLRSQAAETHERWMRVRTTLEAYVADHSGHPPESEYTQRLSNDHNELLQLSSAMQHRLQAMEQRAAEKSKFTDERSIQTEFEEKAFWFRRFHTSLAIAHGGAFAAVGSKLFENDTTAAVAAAAWHPMALFAAGMVIAGSLPLALHQRSNRSAWALAGLSALLFVAGLVAALWAIWRKAELNLPQPLLA